MTVRRSVVGGAALALGFAAALGAGSCNDGSGVLVAKVIEDRSELIGGPVAMADIGDFLLQNDRIRIGILRSVDSPAPGIYGGSVVDMDLRRPRLGFEGGVGRDRFAETFPVGNLMVPEPDSVDISILHDGSDGDRAAIRVEGDGEFLFEALGILRSKKALVDVLFPGVRTEMRFVTDYTLQPGDRHVHVRTLLLLGDDQPEACPPLSACPNDCPNGRVELGNGCLDCACSEVLALDNYTGSANVFGGILGDTPDDVRAGVSPTMRAARGEARPRSSQARRTGAGSGFGGPSSMQTLARKKPERPKRSRKASQSFRGRPVTTAIPSGQRRASSSSRPLEGMSVSSVQRPGVDVVPW